MSAPLLLVTNASEICLPEPDGRGVERLRGRALLARDGRVVWLGPQDQVPADADGAEIYDAAGGAVLPALVDCHTHLIFAGDRVEDFALRAGGTSYAEIAARGGGILTTVRATREASAKSLAAGARQRLEARRKYGIGTTELKSGYGLSVEHETRMLEAAAILRAEGWDLECSLLAAHAVPKDIAREVYVQQITDTLIPDVARRGLARFVDAFVEKSAYTIEEARRVFVAAKAHGLIPRLHADQLTAGGGAELAAEVGAASADHLENASDEGLAAMKDAGVVATLLPGAAVFLGDDVRGLGRRFADAGLEIAVATDANPGSSPLYNLPLAATLATTVMGLTAEQALRAVTLGGAHALRRDDVGTLVPGCRARFAVLDHPDSRSLIYAYGEPIVRDLVVT